MPGCDTKGSVDYCLLAQLCRYTHAVVFTQPRRQGGVQSQARGDFCAG